MSPLTPSRNPSGTYKDSDRPPSNNFANPLHKDDIPPAEYKPHFETPMEILDGFPSCLDRVDNSPPKQTNSGRVLINPNKTMAPRELQSD